MNIVRNPAGPILAALCLVACSDDPLFSGHNNHARLEGEAVGLGITDNALLHKVLPVTLLSTRDGLEVIHASLSRWSEGDPNLDLIVELHNQGAGPLCHLRTEQLRLTVGGTPVGEPRSTPVLGSMGLFEDEQDFNCLAPDENGFILLQFGDDQAPPYDEVDGLELSLEGLLVNPIDPAARIVPKSYALSALSDDPGLLQLAVELDNEGRAAARVPSISTSSWILLDEEGIGLTYGFLWGPDFDDQTLPPGGSGSLVDPLCPCNVFEGTGRVLELRVEFVAARE